MNSELKFQNGRRIVKPSVTQRSQVQILPDGFMKIKIAIQEQEFELSPQEAKRLFDDLSKVFTVERRIVVRPAKQQRAPIYITPVIYPQIMPAPGLLSPPQWEPPDKWTPMCDGYPNTTCGDPLPCPQTICEAVA